MRWHGLARSIHFIASKLAPGLELLTSVSFLTPETPSSGGPWYRDKVY